MGRASASKTAAVYKYTRTSTKTYVFRANLKYDQDIIALLEQQPNVSGYIKSVLRGIAAEKGLGDLRGERHSAGINPLTNMINEEFVPTAYEMPDGDGKSVDA